MADLELTRTPAGRRLYALEGVGTLRLEGVFSRRAVKVTVDDSGAIEPGLLLFATFIVRGLAEDAASGGAGAAGAGG
jgi:hypothetical protein